jgi:diguanylate cyclase (GGDEF)-like protein/PAS domain S-box-containing protein
LDTSFYKALVENLFDGVYFVDTDNRITFWNKGAERITGYAENEVKGSRCSDNILRHIDDSGNELCINGCPLAATRGDGIMREVNVYLHHKEGHRVPVSVRVSPMYDSDGRITGAVEIFSDNSKHRQIITELESLKSEVYLDSLTEIGNRKYALERLQNRMNEFRAFNIPFGILFIDVDKFKSVNDNYGHDAGDLVLKMTARTAANLMRKVDVIARWGGEEFVAIIPAKDIQILKTMAERLRIFIEKSWLDYSGTIIKVTISVGATIVQEGDSPEDVIARADSLMYQSKTGGRNRVTAG